MTHRKAQSTTDKFALFSFTALVLAIGFRLAVTPAAPVVPDTAALIESRIPAEQSIPLAQVMATRVQIERLMAAGMIDEQGLDQAFQLLEQSNYSVDDFVSEKGLINTDEASLKMIRANTDIELYEQYKAMSKLVEQHQPGQ